jgi:LCP family protein required for cell wall assembly
VKWIKIVAALLIVVAGAGGVYAWHVYDSVKETAKQMYQPLKRTKSDLRPQQVSLKKKQPFSILLMGVDKRPGDKGRSDTLMVLTVNPNNHSILMFNIPRDTRTEIVGKGVQDKINHAYAFGGVDMSIRTVEKFLNVPIDYYVQIDMEAFAKVIDQVGGVDVHNKFAFNYEGYSFKAGDLHLNGVEALKYSRMRYDDPRGDFGRTERQRQIVRALIQKAASPAMLTKLDEVLFSLQGSVKTNLTFDEMKRIGTDYKDAAQEFKTFEIKGKGAMIKGVWYYLVDQSERDRVSRLMREQLELNANN